MHFRESVWCYVITACVGILSQAMRTMSSLGLIAQSQDGITENFLFPWKAIFGADLLAIQ